MRWIKLDVDVFRSEKVAGLSDKEKVAYLRSLCWCGERENDGHIDSRVLGEIRIPQRTAERLVDAGLWDQNGSGWVIHDYLEHQESREQLERDREATAKRAKAHRERRKDGGDNA